MLRGAARLLLPSSEAVPERPRCRLRYEPRMEIESVEWGFLQKPVKHRNVKRLGLGRWTCGKVIHAGTIRNRRGPLGACHGVFSCFSLTEGNNRGRRCVCRDRRRLRAAAMSGSGVRSEDGRHMKQPRPRANRIALHCWDCCASNPELIRDGDHDGWPIQKRCERGP